MLLDEIKNIKSSKRDLRNFGLTLGIIFFVLGGLFFWFGKGAYPYLLLLGIGFILPGLFIPRALLPIQKIWMTIAIIIGWLMPRVILSVLFYLMFTSIGFISKLFNKQFLDLKIDKSEKSYWNYRDKRKLDSSEYEKQF